MSEEVKDLFRFCPACGKRFHIRLVGKRLVGDAVETREIKESASLGASHAFAGAPLVVNEEIPVTVEVKDFQYTYSCKHCGHVWTEAHEEVKKA